MCQVVVPQALVWLAQAAWGDLSAPSPGHCQSSGGWEGLQGTEGAQWGCCGLLGKLFPPPAPREEITPSAATGAPGRFRSSWRVSQHIWS